jgi:hypothetical protein
VIIARRTAVDGAQWAHAEVCHGRAWGSHLLNKMTNNYLNVRKTRDLERIRANTGKNMNV